MCHWGGNFLAGSQILSSRNTCIPRMTVNKLPKPNFIRFCVRLDNKNKKGTLGCKKAY